MKTPSGDINVRKLSREMIEQALNDLRAPKLRDESLSWFNARESSVMGYGWCLGHSGLNPNMIRRTINELYHA